MPANPTPLAALARPDAPVALFLDVDGTLIGIAPRPQDVEVPPELPALLERLRQRLDGAVALVSGRALADLDRLFGDPALPAGGQHGLEMRQADGTVSSTFSDGDELAEIVAALRHFVAGAPGTLLEDKGMTVALHFRNAPDREAAARGLAEALMNRHGERFHVQEGKMVLEFKPRGADKGTVVDRFMAVPPFAGRLPVFVGDDVTDEDGFAAVNRRGGLSIQVGDRSPTVAAYRTPSIETLRDWLGTLAGRSEPGSGPHR